MSAFLGSGNAPRIPSQVEIAGAGDLRYHLLTSGFILVRQTIITASQTWNKQAGTRRVLLEGLSGGGAGGSADGAGTSTYCAASGGSGGFYGWSTLLNVEGILSATVVIGAGGTPGAATGADGGSGGATTWNDSVNGTLTWPGGVGGNGDTGQASGRFRQPKTPQSATTIQGACQLGTYGLASTVSVGGGNGGGSPWGHGGLGAFPASGNAQAGVVGSGYGAGGGGAGANSTTTDAQGGAGTAGRKVVWEFA